MSRASLIAEIQDIKERLKLLEEELTVLDSVIFKPKEHETYFFVTTYGEVKSRVWRNDKVDQRLFESFNCFEFKEDATDESEKILVRRKLEQIAKRCNRENPVCWSDTTQDKYGLCLDLTNNRLFGIYENNFDRDVRTYSTVYSSDPNFKKEAIEEIGEGRLFNYFQSFVKG